MNISQAADFLRRLLAGAHPDTGEVLPEDHLLQRADVREALLTALQAMGAQETWGELPLTRSGCLNASRPWTQEDLADLQALYGSGMPIEEIARLIHRRPRGVRLQLNLLAGGGYGRGERVAIPERKGASPSLTDGVLPSAYSPWTPEEEAHLRQLHGEGWHIGEIASTLGRTRGAISSRLKKLGLLESAPAREPRRWEEADSDALGELVDSGMNISDIALELNRTPQDVRERILSRGTEETPPVASVAAPPLPETVAAAISPSRRWTEEDDACLRRAWARGDDVERIVRLMGRRDRLVRCRLIFLGLADHSLLGGEELPPELAHQGLPWYPEEISALQRMFRQGCSDEQMAAELRRSVAAVRSRMDILNLTDAAADEPHA